jgi:hypothetical protein
MSGGTLRVWACFMLARVRTPSLLVREGERERGWEIESGIERERKREYLVLKGMTGALAPFSYQVI